MSERIGSTLARRSTRTFTDDEHATQKEYAMDDLANSFKKDFCEWDDDPSSQELLSRQTSNTSIPSVHSAVNPYGGSYIAAHESAQMSAYILSNCYDTFSDSILGSESLDELKDDVVKKIPGRPVNFGTVIPDVYRSGFPQTEDLAFLKTLGLKTILYVIFGVLTAS